MWVFPQKRKKAMQKIGVVSNREKDEGFAYAKVLADALIKTGKELLLPPELAEALGEDYRRFGKEDVFANCDMVVCLGGDGTFLKAAGMAYYRELPILGINLGSLGFLTEIDKDGIEDAVRELAKGNFRIEERMALKAVISRGDGTKVTDVALNDAVISRGAFSRILHIEIYINDILVDTFPGDGLIVSSPTGSTAYSLSAGGPIVEPDAKLIILTPICPHIMHSRSYITAADRTIKILVEKESQNEAMLTLDGQRGYRLGERDIIEVKKAEKPIRLIRIYSRNFYDILRNKIYDRAKDLRENEI